MFEERLTSIRAWLSTFTGANNEPKDPHEIYLLKSMWIMALSEFEGSVKNAVENYIDLIKTRPISDIHICLLLKHFYDKKDITIENIITIFQKDPSQITYRNFTHDRKAKYKAAAIENLFNTLGVFFTENEKTALKALDSIASTRDSIAHGDLNVAITSTELHARLTEMQGIYDMLQSKLV